MTMLMISVLALLAVTIVSAAGRAIAGRRFEQQLRLVTLVDEDRALLSPSADARRRSA